MSLVVAIARRSGVWCMGSGLSVCTVWTQRLTKHIRRPTRRLETLKNRDRWGNALFLFIIHTLFYSRVTRVPCFRAVISTNVGLIIRLIWCFKWYPLVKMNGLSLNIFKVIPAQQNIHFQTNSSYLFHTRCWGMPEIVMQVFWSADVIW